MVNRKNRASRRSRRASRVKRSSRRAQRASRINSRKSRSQRSRRNSRSRRSQRGGRTILAPMELNDTSMQVASQQSAQQGQQFQQLHADQHGGALHAGAPVGYTGVLDESLRGTAHLSPLDASLKEIAGMSDQTGGRRKRASRSRRTSLLANLKRMLTFRRSRGRKQRGGAQVFAPAAADAPGTLLPADLENVALSGQHPEATLAQDPTYLAPKMA